MGIYSYFFLTYVYFFMGNFMLVLCHPQSALGQRADVDKAALSAREMWLACESLRNALRCVPKTYFYISLFP